MRGGRAARGGGGDAVVTERNTMGQKGRNRRDCFFLNHFKKRYDVARLAGPALSLRRFGLSLRAFELKIHEQRGKQHEVLLASISHLFQVLLTA